MDRIGIDVHKRESQIYILAEGGEVIEQGIRTEPERFGLLASSTTFSRHRPSTTSGTRDAIDAMTAPFDGAPELPRLPAVPLEQLSRE